MSERIFKVGDRVRSVFDNGPEENPQFEGVIESTGTFLSGTTYFRVRAEGGPNHGFLYVAFDHTLEAVNP